MVVIARGVDTLVVAPTGSGKTLAAFGTRPAGDRAASYRRAGREDEDGRKRSRGEPADGAGVLYVSPLKALAVDVERNLRAPLTASARPPERLGAGGAGDQGGVRSGDTSPPRAGARIDATPGHPDHHPRVAVPDAHVQAREALRGVETVIIDEVHAVAGTKRGAHLALSLERLDDLLDRPASGSACRRRCARSSEVAASSAAAARSTMVAPPSEKEWNLKVVVPVEDMTELGVGPAGRRRTCRRPSPARSIWPHVEEQRLDLIGKHRRPSSSPTPGGRPSGSAPNSTSSPGSVGPATRSRPGRRDRTGRPCRPGQAGPAGRSWQTEQERQEQISQTNGTGRAARTDGAGRAGLNGRTGPAGQAGPAEMTEQAGPVHWAKGFPGPPASISAPDLRPRRHRWTTRRPILPHRRPEPVRPNPRAQMRSPMPLSRISWVVSLAVEPG